MTLPFMTFGLLPRIMLGLLCIGGLSQAQKPSDPETVGGKMPQGYWDGISRNARQLKLLYQYLSKKDPTADSNQDGLISADEMIRFLQKNNLLPERISNIGTLLENPVGEAEALAASGKTELLRAFSRDEGLPAYVRRAASLHCFGNRDLPLFESGKLHDAVSEWISNGGDPNRISKWRDGALIHFTDSSILDMLVRRAGIACSYYGPEKTPELRADEVKALQILLEKGANPDITNYSGETPLITAVLMEDPSAVAVLLDHGANPDIRSVLGWNAYDIAKKIKSQGALELLEKRTSEKSGPKDSDIPWYLRYVPCTSEYNDIRPERFGPVAEYEMLPSYRPKVNLFVQLAAEANPSQYYFIQVTNIGDYLEGSAVISLFTYDGRDTSAGGAYGQYMLKAGETIIEFPQQAIRDDLNTLGWPVTSQELREAFRKNLTFKYGEITDQKVIGKMMRQPVGATIIRISKEEYHKISAYLKGHFTETLPIQDIPSLKYLCSDFWDVLTKVSGMLNERLELGGLDFVLQKSPIRFHRELRVALNSIAIDGRGGFFAESSTAYLDSIKNTPAENLDLRQTDKDRVEGNTIIYTPRDVHLSVHTKITPVRYEGEVADGRPHGKGTLVTTTRKIVGFFKEGLPHGGYMAYNGEVLVESGSFSHGKREGLITTYFDSHFLRGIQTQRTFSKDREGDGPFITNEIDYDTGLLTRSFVGERKDGIINGSWKHVVNVRSFNCKPIGRLNDEMFGGDAPNPPIAATAFSKISGVTEADSHAIRKELSALGILDSGFSVAQPPDLATTSTADYLDRKLSEKYRGHRTKILEVLKEPLNLQLFRILRGITDKLCMGDLPVLTFDGRGALVVNPSADVSEAALAKAIGPGFAEYVNSLSSVLNIYQKAEYSETWITGGTHGYVVVKDKYVRVSEYKPKGDKFFGISVTTFPNGDTLEGSLDAQGRNYEGFVTYHFGDDGARLEGTFNVDIGRISGPAVLRYANGHILTGNIIPPQGYISGPATYTYWEKGRKDSVDVNATESGFHYKDRAKRDLEVLGNSMSRAWGGVIHNGNVFKKVGNLGELAVKGLIYPFNLAAAELGLDTVGVTATSGDGRGQMEYGIVIGKNGVGEFGITTGSIKRMVALFSGTGGEAVAAEIDLKDFGIQAEPAESFSHSIQKSGPAETYGRTPGFKVTLIAPVAVKKGTYFPVLTYVKPGEAHDALYSEKLMTDRRWSDDQLRAIDPLLHDTLWNEQELEKIGNQMNGAMLSVGLENFHGVERFKGQNAISSAILAECISWTVERAKNGLKPEYKVRLFALTALLKMSYDNSLWSRLLDKSKTEEIDQRQRVIIYESMEALREFDEMVKKGEIDPKKYHVPGVTDP